MVPGKVDLTTIASNDKKSISVKWEKKTDITGFKIQYSTTSDFKNAKIFSVDKFNALIAYSHKTEIGKE